MVGGGGERRERATAEMWNIATITHSSLSDALEVCILLLYKQLCRKEALVGAVYIHSAH
jgi:hypothetical protein